MTTTDELTTYKRANGDPIDDYGWVTSLDYLTDEVAEIEYLEIVEERWALTSRRVLKLGKLDRWCYECDADIELCLPRLYGLRIVDRGHRCAVMTNSCIPCHTEGPQALEPQTENNDG